MSILETERLVLRRPRVSDEPALLVRDVLGGAGLANDTATVARIGCVRAL